METIIEHDNKWQIVVIHVLNSLIFMIIGHMGETHTDGIPVQFIILIDFSALK